MTTRRVEMERFSVVSSKPFQEILASLKSAVGHPNMEEFARAIKLSHDGEPSIISALQHQKLRRQQTNRFSVLIEHRAPHGDDALVRLGPRRRDFSNFSFDVQDVARTCRSMPGDFSAHADEAVRKWKTACNEKPHCDCRRMPSTRRQSLEDACLGSAFVKMEWLRIKFRRELLDLRRFHNVGFRSESLADGQIFEIQLLHVFSHDAATSSSK
jgi:hypothetical protein